MAQRRNHTKGHHHTGKNIANSRANLGWCFSIRASDRHDSPHCLRHHVITGPIRIRACTRARITKATNSRINQAWVQHRQLFIRQTQTFHDTGAKVFNHHICIAHQSPESGFAIFTFQIQLNALFRSVQANKIPRPQTVGIILAKRPVIPAGVARTTFDLYHLSAVISQHHRAVRPR